MYQLASSVLIAVVSSLLTFYLAQHRFRSERWWERRFEAYTRIIEALHNTKGFSEESIESLKRGGELAEARELDLRKRANLAHEEIEKAVDVGMLILPPTATARLAGYVRETEEARTTTLAWTDLLLRDLSITEECLADLVNIAKSDLNEGPSSWLPRVWVRSR